ncbi:MAG: hypothetical protein PWR04_520 [Anaerophaga sp.]|nr:hypothetical protein [Anaerophaga sp.]
MEIECKALYIFLLWYALSDPFCLTSYHLKSKNLLQSLSCSFHPYIIYSLRSDGTRMQGLIHILIVANYASLVS